MKNLSALRRFAALVLLPGGIASLLERRGKTE